MARRRARELAFRALFEAERGGTPLKEVWCQVRAEVFTGASGDSAYGDALDEETLTFADRLLEAVVEHRVEIDREIESLIEGWSFSQMAQTDLNILRLAVAEMTHFVDVAPEITIDVTVRIAKKYGGGDSGRFVNGVLARLYRDRLAPMG